MKIFRFPAILLLIVLTACNGYESLNNEKPLARVGEKFLYPSDLQGFVRIGYTETDSIQIIQNYIQKWIKTQLMLKKAEANLTQKELQEIYRQLEETRTSLTIYKYEQQLMMQKMDTVVTEQQIEDYYNENTENFILHKNIVKALYIKIPREAPGISRVSRWYRSTSEADMNELESYCYQFASKFDYFSEDWIFSEQIFKELPREIRNEEQFLRYNDHIELQDSGFYYFAAIRDYMLKGSEAPVGFVRNNIRNIILNKRKIEFLKELEYSVFSDGLIRNEFEIFQP